jgi:hypothetical protein
MNALPLATMLKKACCGVWMMPFTSTKDGIRDLAPVKLDESLLKTVDALLEVVRPKTTKLRLLIVDEVTETETPIA